LAARRTPANVALVEQIAAGIERVIAKLTRANHARIAVNQAITRRRVIDIVVNRRLFHGTTLVIRNKSYRITDDVPGPMRIGYERGEPTFRRGDGPPTPLCDIAEVESLCDGGSRSSAA